MTGFSHRCSRRITRNVQRGSQFLTEVQGGSDVGANADDCGGLQDDGSYLISGEEVVLLLWLTRATVSRHGTSREWTARNAWLGLLRDAAPG